MQRAHELLEICQKHHFDQVEVMNDVGFNGMRLADQSSAESLDDRKPNVTSWTFCTRVGCFDDAAFYTDLYAKRNHTVFQDGKINNSPSGFLIVAMKSGDVRQVLVSDIRCISYQGADYLVFPGVRGWREDLPYFSTYENVKQH